MSDETSQRKTRTDRQGRKTVQERTTSVSSDLTRTTTDTIEEPDGSQVRRELAEAPDGSKLESYTRTANHESHERVTATSADGWADTTTRKEVSVDGTIEDHDSIEPPKLGEEPREYYPDTREPLVFPLPADQRGPLTTVETSTVRKSPSGVRETLAEEKVVIQTSKDVDGYSLWTKESGLGISVVPPDSFFGVTLDGSESSVTNTVRTGFVIGPDGKRVDTSEATQKVQLSGHQDDSGKPVTSTVINTWKPTGESATVYENQGFTHEQQKRLRGVSHGRGSWDFYTNPGVADGKIPGEHLRDKGRGAFDGSGDAEDFLLASDDTYTSRVTIARNATGEPVAEVVEWENLDSNGNGRTVTRSSLDEGPVSWTYQENRDQGRDYSRQTVFEGGKLSIFEEMDGNTDGTFQSTTEVKDGDKLLSQYESSRRILTEQEIDSALYAASGEAPLGDSGRLKEGGGPYYYDSTTTLTAATDEQAELNFRSWSLSNSSGYDMGLSEELITAEDGSQTRKTLRTVFDPNTRGNQFEGTLTESEKPAGSSSFQPGDLKELAINSQGQVLLDGKVIDTGTPLPQGQAVSASGDLPQAGKATTSAFAASMGPNQVNPLTTHLSQGALEKLGSFGDLATAAIAAKIGWDRLGQGKYGEALEELGDLTSSATPLVDLAEAGALRYASRASGPSGGAAAWLGSKAGTVSKYLGPAGAAIGLVTGTADLFNAESGHDQAAAALQLASVGAAFIPGVGWAVSLGLGLASLWVAGGDANNTAGIDPRFG